MRIPTSGPKAIYVLYPAVAVVILLLFSIVTVISAVGTYKISIQGSSNLLETKAIDVAVNLGFTLERLGLRQELFPELLDTEGWSDLAFLSLFDHQGKVVLHSNPHLIGRLRKDPFLSRVFKEQKPLTHFRPLATGEEVFILDFPLHLHMGDKSREEDLEEEGGDMGHAYCLRVALHPYPAQEIVRRANLQLAVVGMSLGILWVMAFFFLWTWRKNYKLEAKLIEKEQMALLGHMAAMLAHEIRNPLSSIKGFAQYHMETETDPHKKEDMEIIVEESRRLERLTSDLLAYARPARLNLQEFGIERFCKDLAKTAGVNGNRRVQMNCSGNRVMADREKLMQVSINLLQNAVEAVENDPGARVVFGLFTTDSTLLLEVADTGPGLPEEVKARLYEPFFTTKTKGTGLGLAIVHKLVKAMGGTVSLESRQGEGTTVRVEIPLAPGEGEGTEEEYEA